MSRATIERVMGEGKENSWEEAGNRRQVAGKVDNERS